MFYKITRLITKIFQPLNKPGTDQVVCVKTPHPFLAVGSWYDDFAQTTDEQVRELLAQATAESA